MQRLKRIDIKIPVELVLSKIDENTPKYKSEFFHDVEVNIGTINLKVFKLKGVDCKCGAQGNVFYLEKTAAPGITIYNDWHLNLYAKDQFGHEVLMTKDHTLPKSKGGTDDIDNLTPMCVKCNSRKGDKILSPKQLEETSAQAAVVRFDNNDARQHHYLKTQLRLRETYNLEINEEDYGKMINLANNNRTSKKIHKLTQAKSIKEISFKGQRLLVIYNSIDKLICTAFPSTKTYEELFRIVPSWAKDIESTVLKEYDSILEEAKANYKVFDTDKETALYFKTLNHSKLMFILWKFNDKFSINGYIWDALEKKYKADPKEHSVV